VNTLKHRTQTRCISRRGRFVGRAQPVIAARHRQVKRRPMVEVFMGHTPHDAQLVSDPRDVRHVLAEPHSGNRCWDRVEGTSDLARSIRLRVPSIDLALAPAGKYDEDRFRLTKSFRASSVRRSCPRTSQLLRPEPPTQGGNPIPTQPRSTPVRTCQQSRDVGTISHTLSPESDQRSLPAYLFARFGARHFCERGRCGRGSLRHARRDF